MTGTNVALFRFGSLAVSLLTIPSSWGWVTRTTSHQRQTIHHDNRISACPLVPSSLTSTSSSLLATAVNEEEIVEYLDDDDVDGDSDYDPQAALEQQAAWLEELGRLAKTSSTDPSAVASAQAIFDDMFQAYVEHEDATFFPTVAVYNLLIETHAYSRSNDGGREAQSILTKMQDASNDFVSKPNEETYLKVMDAWAIRKEPLKVQQLLEGLESPSIHAHNKLLKAYGMAGDFEAAESHFRSLLQDDTADHNSWVQIMKARASCPDDETAEPASTNTVESYFDELQRHGIEPETAAYNVLIRSVGSTKGFQTAEGILFQMIGDYRAGNDLVKPNLGTFRALLGVYHKQGPKKLATSSSASKVEQLLQFLDGLQLDPSQHPTDAAKLYQMALEVMCWSKDSKKARKADRIFQKAKTGAGSISVLKACAGTLGNSEERFAAFQIALGVLKDLRSNAAGGLQLTSSAVGLFLQCCHQLMPKGSKRDAVVAKVFSDACERGLVNDFVLNEFEAATSEDLQLELLGGFSVDGVSIPESWSRNVE